GGMTGVLYKQFALTIAISMALSAFVALTLTPALCAMILKPKDPNKKKGILDKAFDAFNNWFERTKNGYVGIVAAFIKRSGLSFVCLAVICILMGFIYVRLPSTFVPEEDQGYFMAAISLPEGTSMNNTIETIEKLTNGVMQEMPGLNACMSAVGFDILSGGSKPSSGIIVCSLKSWGQREVSVQQCVGLMFKLGAKYAPEAQVIAFNPPALPGLGNVGGWSLQLQDMAGHTNEELNEIVGRIVAKANQRPELQGVRTTFNIASPTIEYKVDREKVKLLGVEMDDVFSALQVNFGGMQVNDFNQFGRTYKVVLQSDTLYRAEADSAKFIFVKGNDGQRVPLDTLITPKRSTGPTQISRFNISRAVAIQGNAGAGYSSGEALTAIEEVVREEAGTGFNIEWSGQSREEKKASSSTMQVLALALVFVFLMLAALYESWSVPFAVLFTVPTGIFGAVFAEFALAYIEGMFGIQNSGLQNSVYMQIGIITIIGLAAKNAILIVEFAKVRVDRGMRPVKAAIEAAGLRLRPILMTSLAFIIGCLPLAMAAGAGSAARNGMGVAVVGGMLFATAIGIFLIPVFFVIVEFVAEKLGFMKQEKRKSSIDYM
ncbi:MAG: efflux RND transporter permease subunit, partial [Selenomonadaceae bacterium]|nr:efflux RND transporter permease subunit [Selenomonadaceae bacterium]